MRRFTRNNEKRPGFETLEARTLLAADVIISEFMAANQRTLNDGFGSSADWVELHNQGDESADLTGFHLTDDDDNLSKWSFPDGTTVDAGGYLLVFASGFDTVDPKGDVHSNFRLDPSGDYLALTNSNLQVLSEYGTDGGDYVAQFADVSYGVSNSIVGFFTTPTPGEANGAEIANIGPSLRRVTNDSEPRPSNQEFVVTAQVDRYLADVADVSLTYRVMFGDEVNVAMKDDGDALSGDTLAGDGIYSAKIPGEGLAANQMVRWYVSATDVDGNASRAPAFLDNSGSDQSPEYFGTIVQDEVIDTNLNVWQWFIDPENERRADTRGGTRSSLYYGGEFYDNVFVRVRGGSSDGLVKKSYKFDFNTSNDFRFDPEFGRVREINLNTTYSNKDYIRQALTFETYDQVGLPGSEAFPVRVERNGEFFSVAIVVEQPDAQMLEREGLDPEGAFYKMFNRFQRGNVEKRTRTYEDNSDLNAIIDAVNDLNGEELRNHVFDHINIPDLLNYLAATVITQNNDQLAKNYFAYRDTNGTGEWSIFPWDLDLVFGLHFMSNDSILDDLLFADEDGFTTFANVTIWPSHPFVGDEAHPGNRSWNRLIDALYEIPEFREMYLRRLRTLMDDLLQPPGTPQDELRFEARLDEYVELLGNDATLDYERWANPWRWGEDLTMVQAIDRIKEEYLRIRRVHLYETHSVDNIGQVELIPLVAEFADASFFVPSDNNLGSEWTQVDFDDSNWTVGPTGIGFENSPRNFTELINTRVKPQETAEDSTSIFLRMPFTVDDVSQIEDLTLRMRYDDGFVAFINGVEVQRDNLRSEGEQFYNSRARGRSNTLVVEPRDFIISEHVDALRSGENVLAVHIMNSSATGSDLLVVPELLDGAIKTTDVAGIPHAQLDSFDLHLSQDIDFNPESGNQDEEYLIVENRNGFAVDISGWQLQGSAHTTFRKGVVIPSNGQLFVTPNVVAFRNRATGPSGGQGHFVQSYDGHLNNEGDTLRLLDSDGRQVTSLTYLGNTANPQQSLRITEISYNPYDSLTAFGEADTDNDSFEFLEVTNTGDTPVQLTGARLRELEFDGDTQGVSFDFGDQTLAPGERAVIVKDQGSFESRYGTEIRVLGEFTGKLSNGGETITFTDSNDDAIQQFRYNDRNGWPIRADGRGSSLEILDPAGDPDSADNWRASQDFLGSPGTAGSTVDMGVVINEVLSLTVAPELDRIELFNSSASPVSIGGWWLTDSADLFKFQIDSGTVLQPRGYLVLDEQQLGFGFKGDDSDDATLASVDEKGRPEFFVDSVQFGAATDGKSWSRVPNGTGSLRLANPTLGSANSDSRPGDFNNDSQIDIADLDLLCQEIRDGDHGSTFDLNSDSSVDQNDLDIMLQDILNTTKGDSNLDGRFDSRDLVQIFQAGKYNNPDLTADWSEGDWNCDGHFDSRDLVVAFQQGGYIAEAFVFARLR